MVASAGAVHSVAVLVASSSGGGAVASLVGLAVEIVLLVWAYNLAKRKGRHPVGWLVLVFFFSLLAFVVLLLLPSKRTTDAS
jgi:hypothetical protein